jgi:hypothetical protein
VLEIRSALLCEGSHAFLLVGGGEGGLEAGLLVRQTLGQRALERLVDAVLAQRRGDARVGRDLLAHGERGRQKLLGLDDASNEARALGLGGGVLAAGEAPLHRARLADERREALRAAHAGDGADLDLGLAEDGLVGGKDDVHHHGELAAAAERVAVDGGDGGLADLEQAVEVLEHVGVVPVDELALGHLLDVRAGDEGLGLRVAGDDDAADVGVLVERLEGGGELGGDLAVERVHLAAREGDERDALGNVSLEEFRRGESVGEEATRVTKHDFFKILFKRKEKKKENKTEGFFLLIIVSKNLNKNFCSFFKILIFFCCKNN